MGLWQDEKACFSKVNHSLINDFSVTLLDSQNLQLLQKKLLRTSSVLDSCLDVLKGCETHCRKLVTLNVASSGEQYLVEIMVYKKQIQGHRRELHRITQQSFGTSKLV